MDNQERDLILDLATGALPAAEARVLEDGLSAAARVELEHQRMALAAIAGAATPALTDLERQRLHNMVAEGVKDTTREMHAAAIAAPARPAAPPRTLRWMRFAYGAAAAAVFVAAVGVGSQLDLGGNDATAASDTTVPTVVNEALTLGDGGSEDDSLSVEESDQAPAAEAATTTTAAASAGADAALAPPIAPPIDKAFEARDLGRIQAWVDSQVLDESVDPAADPTQLNCFPIAVDDLEVVAGFITPYRDQATNQVFDAVGFASEGELGQDPEVRLYDPGTCELLSATSP